MVENTTPEPTDSTSETPRSNDVVVVVPAPTERPPVQDHKPKSKKKKNKKKRAALKAEASGGDLDIEIDDHTWTVPVDVFDDAELLEDIDEIDHGNYARTPKVLRRILGDKQYEAAKDTLRDEKRIVRLEALAEFFYKIVQAANPS